MALAGLGVFAVGALAGAAAPPFDLLLGARVVQGAGAGLVSPAAMAGAVSGFGPERRGAALGAWGAERRVANLVGPLLGGGLTVAFGWRADWWVLVPLAIMAAAGILACLPRVAPARSSAPARGAFNPIVLAAAWIAGLTFAVMIGCVFVAEQFLQRRTGDSALGAGAVLMLVALVAGGVSSPAGRLADQRGERLPMVLGFLIAAAGLGALAIPALALTSVWALIPVLAVGSGSACCSHPRRGWRSRHALRRSRTDVGHRLRRPPSRGRRRRRSRRVGAQLRGRPSPDPRRAHAGRAGVLHCRSANRGPPEPKGPPADQRDPPSDPRRLRLVPVLSAKSGTGLIVAADIDVLHLGEFVPPLLACLLYVMLIATAPGSWRVKDGPYPAGGGSASSQGRC